jgi:hypothetical protein
MRSLFAIYPLMALVLASPAVGEERHCDRACLERLLTGYLDAVIKHDPSSARLAEGYRQTENAKAVPAGEGVWQSATGFGKLHRHFLDPVNGSVGFYGTMLEGDKGMIVTLRLLVDEERITEAEWYIARSDDPTAPPPGPGIPNFVSVEGAETTAPPVSASGASRTPRRVLIAAANAYFDALQTNDESLMSAQPHWLRLENGFGTGRAPGGSMIGRPGVYAGKKPEESAMSMPGLGTCNSICNVAARRYPIVDEQAGVVLGLVVFQRPPGFPMARNLLSEWFTIENGKVTGIYAVMHFLAPTTPAPNWAPFDGNFPLSFDAAASPASLSSLPFPSPTSLPAAGK